MTDTRASVWLKSYGRCREVDLETVRTLAQMVASAADEGSDAETISSLACNLSEAVARLRETEAAIEAVRRVAGAEGR